SDAVEALCRYTWPGNVRELENVVQRAAVVAKGDTILSKDLPAELLEAVLGTRPALGSRAPFQGEAVARGALLEPAPATPPKPAPEDVTAPGMTTPSDATADSAGDPPDTEHAFDRLFSVLRASIQGPILPEIERAMIERTLAETSGNQVKASQILGITRATLRKRIDQYQLRL
ncbi:MAG: helix-turn-helix domain-containing protein, partial [Opitutales bacterium]